MAQSVKYRDTGFQYVRGSESVVFSNGVLLSVEEFDRLDKMNGVVQEILRRKKKDENLYDFSIAVSEGVLRKLPPRVPEKPDVRGSFNKIQMFTRERAAPTPEEDDKDEQGQEEAAPEKPVEEVPLTPSPPSGQHKAPLPPAPAVDRSAIVEWVMTLVAGGSAVMSAYHTSLFMWQSGKPLWISLLTGVIMIFFSATAFTAARYFFMEKNASLVFGFLFIILGFGVVCYSMFSTVTVNFNQFSWKEAEERTTLIEQSAEIAVANELKHHMLMEVQRLDGEIERLQAETEGWRNQSWRRYDDYAARLDDARARRNVAWDAYVNAGTTRLVAESNVVQARNSIYSFVFDLFGWPEDVIRFLVYTIPSVFYDIASPFGFTIILFLRERRKKDGEEKKKQAVHMAG